MRPLLIALPLVAAAAFASPARAHDDCSVVIGSSLSIDGDTWTFGAKGDRPEVRLSGDRLQLGERGVTLGEADRARVAELSRELDELGPEVRDLALEAVDIAFVALEQVGVAFDIDADTTARIAAARRDVQRSIRANPGALLDERKAEAIVETVVESVVADLVPEITGAAITQALSLAFSGDDAGAQAFEARMARMESTIEHEVEARAEALEPRARAVCRRLERIDTLDNALEVRTADGDTLDLITVRRGSDRTAAN